MITYNDIYEASRKERYSDRLCPIQKKFVSEVSVYLKEKKEAAMKEEDSFSDVVIKTKKQLENAITLFRELMLRRRKKILNLVLIAAETGISKQDFDNMLSFEKDLFEEIMKCVEASDKTMNSLLNGATEKEDKKKNLFLSIEPEMYEKLEALEIKNKSQFFSWLLDEYFHEIGKENTK